jgi:tRNA modification GTPase
MHPVDTICVISSPLGEGGIGILRISGPQVRRVLKAIFRPRKHGSRIESHRLTLGYIIDPRTGAEVDEVFAVFMKRPRTYTREDMAEVYSHGGLAPQRRILTLMIESGARIAEPGEFTKRAFLNGRIDLVQAESVLDIVQSESEEELRYALQQLKGILSDTIEGMRDNLKKALAEVEAQIDFPEEEIDISAFETITHLERARNDLSPLISSYSEGRAVKYGVEVLIVGRTNVGKSSLLNRLLMEERAIVTPLPGTTRDMIEDTIHVRGLKLRIVDTAGLRRPKNVIEEKGIERVRARIPNADIILWVLDSSQRYSSEDEEVFRAIEGKNVIGVVNKIDLPRKLSPGSVQAKGFALVETSALTGGGIEQLKDALYERFAAQGHDKGSLLVTNIRHRDALAKALTAVERATTCLTTQEPLEFAALEIREALDHLGQIMGECCTEDILNDIFSRFCIGK